MPVNHLDLHQWAKVQSIKANAEIDYRVIAGRAYYYAYFKCIESLLPDPDGMHAPYINTLKKHSDRAIRRIGYNMDTLKGLRKTADYKCHLNFIRQSMLSAIGQANLILKDVDDYNAQKVANSSTS